MVLKGVVGVVVYLSGQRLHVDIYRTSLGQAGGHAELCLSFVASSSRARLRLSGFPKRARFWLDGEGGCPGTN